MLGTPMEKAREQVEPLLPPPPPPPTYGIPVPSQDPYYQPPAYLLLPVFPRRRRRVGAPCRCCGSLLSASSLLTLVLFLAALSSALFFMYPSDPGVKITRLRLENIHVSTFPVPAVDVSLGLELMIRNRDFFSLDYHSLDVAIGYRGRRLGFAKAGSGHLRARGVTYIDAELRLDGIQVLSDVVYLIQDLASGSIPFETVTEVQGHLRILFLDVPIQGRFSCAVHINAENQTVVRQDCYPE